MVNNILYKITLCCLLLLSAPAAFATGAFNGFIDLDRAGLKPFARDLGGLLGSGLNQTARPLGFSGFDIGVRAVSQVRPSPGNTALHRNRPFSLGFVQAELGMPYRIDGFIRAGSYEGLAIAGGGLRYGLWNVSDQKNHVNAMLVLASSLATHKYFHAVHFNASVVCSVNRPVFSPYVGVGFDSTSLQAKTYTGTLGDKAKTVEMRYSAGVRAKLKLFYLAAGATYTHDRALLNASTGLRF
ncbi:MAG: hypothetical protein ACYC2I_05205 [Elusimicrobiales bacterium]